MVPYEVAAMLDVEHTKHAVRISYRGHSIIRHEKDHPAFFVGMGTERITSTRGHFEITDDVRTQIALESFEIQGNTIRFFHRDVFLTVTFEEKNERLHIRFQSDRHHSRFWMNLVADKSEKIFGAGAQASYLNLRGRIYPLWSSEPGVGRDPNSLTTKLANAEFNGGGDYYTTYYPEPTFISSKGYWLHVDTYAYARFDFARDDTHEIHAWEVPNEIVMSFHPSYLDLITDFTSFSGRPPRLPNYVHNGIILGLQGGLDHVLTIYEKAKTYGIEIAGLWCQDWAGSRVTSFGKRLHWNWVLDEANYPNLKHVIERLEQENTRFLTYICPYLLSGESLFTYAEKNRYLVRNKAGNTYLADFGEFSCGIVDLTNPQAYAWYKSIIKKNIIRQGVKGYMADFGEYLPTDCILHNGKDATIMHNAWPLLWAKCNYEAVREENKLGEVFYFMRSGAHGSQKYATALWVGDQSVNWEKHDGIPSVIPATLSLGLTGIPFVHSDIGGYTSLFHNKRSKELFDRWLEMNVFSSVMRTHEGNRPSENFQFYDDEHTLSLMAKMTRLRVALKPYILDLIDQATAKGYPLQRPLFLHDPDDRTCYEIEDAFLFGQDLLVAPVIEKDKTARSVYFPSGTWVHLWTGRTYLEHTWNTVFAPVGYPPVFYRKDASFSDLFYKIFIDFAD
jgi:sulfoquinovosidase